MMMRNAINSNRSNDHEADDMSNNDDDADAMLMITTRKHKLTAMFRCASHSGTLATVRIEIADVQTTNALIAASKDTSGGFARMCSVRIAIFLVT